MFAMNETQAIAKAEMLYVLAEQEREDWELFAFQQRMTERKRQAQRFTERARKEALRNGANMEEGFRYA